MTAIQTKDFGPLSEVVDEMLIDMYEAEEQRHKDGIFSTVLNFSQLKQFIDHIGEFYWFLVEKKPTTDSVAEYSHNLSLAQEKYLSSANAETATLDWLKQEGYF